MAVFRKVAVTRLLAVASVTARSSAPVTARIADETIETRLERLDNRTGITPGGGEACLRGNNIELRVLGYVQGQAM